MQARYGQPMDEDELRMHATSIRSNIMSTMRLLCKLVQELGLEDQLAAESAPTISSGILLFKTHLLIATSYPTVVTAPWTSLTLRY